MKGKIDRAIRPAARPLRTSGLRRLHSGRPARGHSRRWRLRPSDFIVILLCLAGVYFFLRLFWLDYTGTLAKIDTPPVGTITWKYKAAQRRFADRAIWDRLQKESNIYNGDHIRTAELSEATITFTEGISISLTENSMIQIFSENNTPQVDVISGDVSVDTTVYEAGAATGETRRAARAVNAAALDPQNPPALVLNAGGRTISVAGGTVMDAHVAEGGDLNISVSEGSAALLAGTGETRRVEAGEALALDQEGRTLDIPQTVMRSPKPLARLINRGFPPPPAMPVEFAWDGVNYAPASRTRIEVSEDRNFRRIAHTQDGERQGRALIALAPGVWFWRAYPVSADAGEAGRAASAVSAETAGINKLTILSVPPTETLSPEEGHEFRYRSKPPAIRFQWTASPNVASYLLEAADNPGFTGPALRESVQGGPGTALSLTHSGLENGRWYWRVTPVMDDGPLESSGTASFTITQSGDLPVPILVNPPAEAVINLAEPRKDIYFSWQNEAEAGSYTLLISLAADLRNPLITRQVAANYYAYNSETALADGRYYWGVYQTGLDGEVSSAAPSRSFIIRQWEPVLRPTFPPDRYTVSGAGLRETRFTWRTNLSTPLRFQVSDTPAFSRLEVDEEVTGLGFPGPALADGRWYWRLAGTGSTQSEALSLWVMSALGAPVLTGPRAGPITAGTGAATAFTWQGVENAESYTLNLYAGSGANGRAIRSVPNITGTRLEIPLDAYQAGTYTWTVQAFANEMAGSARLSGPLASAAFTLQAPPQPLPLLGAPQNRRPSNGYTLGVEQLRSSSAIAFSWDAVPGANRYNLALYREEAGGRRLLRRWESSAQTSRTLDDLSILGNGSFIWEVEALSQRANGAVEQRGSPGENRFTVNLPALPRDTPRNPGRVYGQ